MDANEATSSASQSILTLFGNQPIKDVGLEEIEFDDENDEWIVTIGFTREWENRAANNAGLIAQAMRGGGPHRTYKIVRLKQADGKLVSIRNRKTDG